MWVVVWLRLLVGCWWLAQYSTFDVDVWVCFIPSLEYLYRCMCAFGCATRGKIVLDHVLVLMSPTDVILPRTAIFHVVNMTVRKKGPAMAIKQRRKE